MSLAAALLMIAQSATPIVADAPAPRSGPVAVSVSASATILRPARIAVAANGEVELTETERSEAVQRGRDAAGTVWIEFS